MIDSHGRRRHGPGRPFIVSYMLVYMLVLQELTKKDEIRDLVFRVYPLSILCLSLPGLSG